MSVKRRLTMGAEARVLGHGGIAVVARAAGVSRVTVTAVSELEAGGEPLGRTRHVGGGRKSVTKTDPGAKAALLALVEPGRVASRCRRCDGRPRACAT